MAIVLPGFFRVWSRLGREAYDAEERIGHVEEQEVAVENDHWLRSTGVLRYPMATNVYGDGQAWGPSISIKYGGAITGGNGDLLYTSRMQLADGRTRINFRVHWGAEAIGQPLGTTIGAVQIKIDIYDGNTATLLDTASFGGLTSSGTYALNTYPSTTLASTDVRIEIYAVVTTGPPTGRARLFSVLAVEDAMTVGEL